MKQFLIFTVTLCLNTAFICALPADSAAFGGWAQQVYTPSNAYVLMRTVIPYESFYVAGLQPDDRIIAVNTNDYTLPGATNILQRFKKELKNTTGAITCIFVRSDVCMTGYIKRIPTRALSIVPAHIQQKTSIARDIFPSAEYSALTNALIYAVLRRQDMWHTPLLDMIMQQPVLCGQIAREKIAKEKARPAGVAGQFATSEHVWSAFTSDIVRACAMLHDAWNGIPTQQWRSIAKSLPGLADGFDQFFYLQDDTNHTRYLSSYYALTNVVNYDYEAVREAYNICARWSSPKMLKQLSNAVCSVEHPKAPASAKEFGSVLACPTKYGAIVVGCEGRNTYRSNATVIIDIGGDDKYEMSGSVGPEHPFQMIIDLSGNDRFTYAGIPGPAGSICGINILIDADGDDYYSAPRMALGSAWMGFAGLYDYKGDDIYLCQRFGHGCGFFGTGKLYDYAGNDTYIAQRFSQGFGMPGGEGILYDKAGDDSYTATLGTPSTYGTPGIYSTFSQGMGCGFRLLAAGGIGLLIDDAGNDRYTAGNFAQGCGYYLGTGILYDQEGDDMYNAVRYVQGSGAHTAIGIFIDDAGNDKYLSHNVAGPCLSWDTTVTWCEDTAGNDSYRCQGTGLAAAHLQSFAVMYDGAGADTYYAPFRAAIGCSRGTATNCAYFCDMDGKNDRWHVQGATLCAPTNIVRGTFGVLKLVE